MTTTEASAATTPGASVVDYRMLIGDEWVAGGDGRWLPVDDPFTGQVWARVPHATVEQADAAVRCARAAFDRGPWGSTTPGGRAALLRRLAALVAENVDELTELQVRENGKAIREQHGQTAGLVGHLTYFAGLAENIRGETIPAGSATSFCYTTREPIGVVAALVPWNSPLTLLLWKFSPALAAGNTMVVKPSEVTPVSTLRFAELVLEAGIPPGVFNVVTGLADVGAALTRNPDVDKVAFTGSTAVGKEVAKAAVEHLARFTLELGGKSPNIVFADANLDVAVDGVVGGVFAAAGQTCIAGSRVLVQDSIYDEFTARLVERTSQIRLGNPLDWDTEVGTIASRPQFERVQSCIRMAVDEGATLLAGGKRPEDPALAGGMFIEPTIFGDVDTTMRIAQEEVFGPVVTLIRFDDDDDAIRIAHDTRFGLAAGVWTKDVGRAHRMARRLRAGTVWVNTYRRGSFMLPFGGFGDSGIGRENGREAIDEYTEVKSVWLETDETPADPFQGPARSR